MSTQDIVQKLWNLCNVLRDDGITYHQYVTELTYILFLKMAKETGAENDIPAEYRWESLLNKSGIELKKHYKELLSKLGEVSVDDNQAEKKALSVMLVLYDIKGKQVGEWFGFLKREKGGKSWF